MLKSIAVTNARYDLFNIIRNSIKRNEQYRIVSRDGAVILIPEEFYESMIETLELLSIPKFKKKFKKARKEIKDGETYSVQEVFGE